MFFLFMKCCALNTEKVVLVKKLFYYALKKMYFDCSCDPFLIKLLFLLFQSLAYMGHQYCFTQLSSLLA